jgi:hypothetical protein
MGLFRVLILPIVMSIVLAVAIEAAPAQPQTCTLCNKLR